MKNILVSKRTSCQINENYSAKKLADFQNPYSRTFSLQFAHQ